jgi:flagellar hook-basal body complex protein FliE
MRITPLEVANVYSATQRAGKSVTPQDAFAIAEQSMQYSGVLRQGDDLQLTRKGKVGRADFRGYLRQSTAQSIRSIKNVDNTAVRAMQPDRYGNVVGVDNIELIQSMDRAEESVKQMVAIASKFIEAWRSLQQMPL